MEVSLAVAALATRVALAAHGAGSALDGACDACKRVDELLDHYPLPGRTDVATPLNTLDAVAVRPRRSVRVRCFLHMLLACRRAWLCKRLAFRPMPAASCTHHRYYLRSSVRRVHCRMLASRHSDRCPHQVPWSADTQPWRCCRLWLLTRSLPRYCTVCRARTHPARVVLVQMGGAGALRCFFCGTRALLRRASGAPCKASR